MPNLVIPVGTYCAICLNDDIIGFVYSPDFYHTTKDVNLAEWHDMSTNIDSWKPDFVMHGYTHNLIEFENMFHSSVVYENRVWYIMF